MNDGIIKQLISAIFTILFVLLISGMLVAGIMYFWGLIL